MSLCNICKRELNKADDPVSLDCGGDCRLCMADAGDPDCIAQLHLFSFGISHAHSVHLGGRRFTLDTDGLLGVVGDAGAARQTVFDLVGPKWAFQYEYSHEKVNSVHFPRGVDIWITADE